MKSKKSITRKLFAITSIVFIVFITTNLIVQSAFFEQFYIKWKKNNLEHNLVKFKSEYSLLQKDEDKINLVSSFEENNNYKIITRDRLGNLKYLTKTIDERKDSIKVRIMNQIMSSEIENSGGINKFKEEGKSLIFTTEETPDMVASVSGILYAENSDEIVYAFASLQPVNEAVQVIKVFYLYFYIGALVITLFLSLIYSSMIAKPLIKITKTAAKMAKLDLTEKCEVKSEDEIGALATSLNLLSENLNEALTSLKESNAQLEKDIEKEKKLTEMRKDFVASVSHELKTPITLIEGYTLALNDDVLEGAEKQYFIDVIMDESRKMNNLVSDMLNLSQLESGNFKLIEEVFFLDELINPVTKKFSSLLNEKNIKLELNLIQNVKVNADWNRIEQVLTNYMTNAIRHTYDGGSITVKMINIEGAIRVEVENSGSKIDDTEKNKIWDNFYKIDKSRTRKLGGTGLGLSIVKNIVLLHGGSCGVENTEIGVEFYFILKKQ
ncbi:cell wall metabolism sensor histidine kinase WalK [Clostridium sp. CF011]|uniref:sensor histidine kinase n=1 Tax=Clostridium sp. CF011 TaxID=2843318 RepID=UPI001C0DDE5F|nr:HAMP domain-containing sensor histidine kinase [Clostridium sp. CF011]MBU3092714.1 cell wall metabolism sensor histidine kinase WalK [Clostridium sp. CF011]WAG70546.1 cell wall metabolism sensor histidine kinase WalK [Clostridium sp. CF011]